MNRSIPFRVLLALAVALGGSCSEKAPPDRADKDKETDFYYGIEPSLELASFENEMAGAATDFLQSFSGDDIAWQQWDQELLAEADKAQAPIFAFVASSRNPHSRQVAREISQRDELRELITATSLCTVVDVRVHPAMGLLAHRLAGESSRPFSLPMALWLSPEGNPIAWFAIGRATGDDLSKIIENSSAMVNDTWKNGSKYAMENSRFDNRARQKRLDYDFDLPETEVSRSEIFQRSTRKLSSYYNAVNNQLDFVGGLVPTSSLELLALGSRSKILTTQTRERCRLAIRDVARNLTREAMRDPLDGGYFHARISKGWVLPSFTKTLESQARVALMLMQAGSTLDREDVTREGLALLKILENNWVAPGLALRTLRNQAIRPGSFLWSIQTLGDFLTEEELELARKAFSLEEEGNLPFEVDPLGKLAGENSLRNRSSLEELAAANDSPIEEVSRTLDRIKSKLRNQRAKKNAVAVETTLTLFDLTMILRAQVTRAAVTGKKSHLETATEFARNLLDRNWDPQTGLTRVRAHGKVVPARGRDYAALSYVLTLIHQLTLEDQWLVEAQAILDFALGNLTGETALLAEIPPEERIVPLRQHDFIMIFGETTVGFADRAAHRLAALTGQERYQNLLAAHLKLMAPRPANTVVTHTDFVVSCALGNTPLIAVLQGDRSLAPARELLTVLNHPVNLPFLTVRPEASTGNLTPLPPLPPAKDGCSVVLIHDGEVLGQASDPASLQELLDRVISN